MNKLKRFDRIVSSLEKKGNSVEGKSFGFLFDYHSFVKGECTDRHSSGEINSLVLDVDKENDCVNLILISTDEQSNFLLRKYKGNLTATERFTVDLGRDPETGLWDEDEVELDINPDDGILDTLLDIAECLASRKETAYKEQLIVETDEGCFFYLYDADGDIVGYPAKNIVDAVNKIDERLASEGLYDADGNLNKTI